MSRETDKQLQRTLEILEDILISVQNLDKMFPLGTPERTAVDSAFHGLDRSIDLLQLAENELSEHHEEPLPEAFRLEGPPTRLPPWVFNVESGGWISANDKSLNCLQPVTFTCRSYHSPNRRTVTWKCRVTGKDEVDLCVGMGSTRDRALRHVVLKIRAALGDPSEPTQDTFHADPFLLGEYFERA